MLLLFGTGEKTVSKGIRPDVFCPGCGCRVSMLFTKHYAYAHLYYVPIFRYHVTYDAACPICAAMSLVDKHKAARFLRDPAAHLEPADMTPVRRSRRQCPGCGQYVELSDTFCSGCGQKL